MNYSYFLGSNSKDGFYSLYDSFPPAEGDYLHILKGGPGSGKSCFMRKIGTKAEEMGYTVHYILCSGDPDSLDGVYIPERKISFVDGTSPHAREPKIYGVDSDYIHLGYYFNGTLTDEEKDYIQTYTVSYKAEYSAAYPLLSAAAAIKEALLPEIYVKPENPAVKEKVYDILDRILPSSFKPEAQISKRFLSCAGCRGDYRLSGEIQKLCKLVYQFEDPWDGAVSALKYAAAYGEEHGHEMILCPDPISPQALSAVIFTRASVGFVGPGWNLPQMQPIPIDNVLPSELWEKMQPRFIEAKKICKALQALAFEKMADAKQLHDLLEAVYRPHIDFEALTQYTNKCISQYLF